MKVNLVLCIGEEWIFIYERRDSFLYYVKRTRSINEVSQFVRDLCIVENELARASHVVGVSG